MMLLDTDCPEEIEVAEGRTDDNSRQLWVPVQLLDLLLTLMDEQQLRKDLRFVLHRVVLLKSKVPQRQLVVFARGR